MRVFTDGACSHNGKPGAKAGYAVWFPEHKDLRDCAKLPADQSQTNQRAELSAIHRAIVILDEKGYHDEDVMIYTDSDYSINCLTKWIPGWVSRGWKTAEGKDVLHQDLIRDVSARLSKFKSHRFVHVRAHTGGSDDLSVNNDIVDRMARSTIDDTVSKEIALPSATDVLFEGCPLQLLGSPVGQTAVMAWLKTNLNSLPPDIVEKHLFKAFVEACKAKDVAITKQTIQKAPMLRAERIHLQITHPTVDKEE